jgi:hypothetical protein
MELRRPTMTGKRTAPRIIIVFTLALALGVFALSAPTWASSASEPQQGAQLLSEIHAGKVIGASLTSTQYQRVGQYLMGRALGSTQSYEAMDSLMDRMMGQAGSDQMYLYLGERYLGRNVQPDSRYAPDYGWMASMMGRYGGSDAGRMSSYMMGAYRSLSGSGAVPYAGMMGGYPTGQSGQGTGTTTSPTTTYLRGGMMGYSYGAHGTSNSGGWPTAAVLAVALLGAALLGGGLAFLLRRRRAGPGTSAAPAAR